MTNISYFKRAGWTAKRLQGNFYSVINEARLMAEDPPTLPPKKKLRRSDDSGNNNKETHNHAVASHNTIVPVVFTCSATLVWSSLRRWMDVQGLNSTTPTG